MPNELRRASYPCFLSGALAVAFAATSFATGACVPRPAQPAPTGGEPGTGGSAPAGTGGVGTGGMGVIGTGGTIATDTGGRAGTVIVDPGTTGDATCVDGMPVDQTMRVPTDPASQPLIPTTVTKATKPVPPLSGGTLLALADGVTMVASDPERDQIYVVDTGTSTLLHTVALQDGDEPGRLAEDASGRVHVALRRGGAIVTIDPKAGTIAVRRAVCAAPRGLAYDAAGDQLHVACAGGQLVTLPASGGAATRTVTLERDLRDVVVGSGGTLLVSVFRSADVLVLDGAGKITSRLQAGSGQVPNILGEIETRTPAVAWRMLPFDAASNEVLLLHQSGVTDPINPKGGGYAGTKGCGGIVRPGVCKMKPGMAPPMVSPALMMVSLAIDIAVSPDHTKLAMAVPGNSQNQGPMVAEAPLETFLPEHQDPCAGVGGDSTMKGQVVAVAYSPGGVLFAQTREPATLWRADTGATISLASDSRADTGQFIFHANAGGNLACASCHPEGGEDGRVWNFVCAGARRTQSMRGGISQTAPFHWDGSETDISRLMDDVFTGRMAGPALTVDQKDALAAWIDTVPALPVATGLDTTALARGRALFEDPGVGCASCHAGALFTNNQTVDVGTGSPLQVPSLLGVAWRAPFMHTGCAPTLSERFTSSGCGGGDLHGVTSTLTAGQVADLTTYLQSL